MFYALTFTPAGVSLIRPIVPEIVPVVIVWSFRAASARSPLLTIAYRRWTTSLSCRSAASRHRARRALTRSCSLEHLNLRFAISLCRPRASHSSARATVLADVDCIASCVATRHRLPGSILLALNRRAARTLARPGSALHDACTVTKIAFSSGRFRPRILSDPHGRRRP